MKKIGSFILFMVIFQLVTEAQPISGTKTIPGDYPTIAAAVAALNTEGVGSGGVIFNVAAGHGESITSGTVILNTTTTSATDTIVFRKWGSGANPKISGIGGGSTGTIDPVLGIAGTDYVTFDAIDIEVIGNNLIELGYAIFKKNGTAPFDGCHYITIKNCTITFQGTSTKTYGIYSRNHTSSSTSSLSVTTIEDATSNFHIDNNTISGYNGMEISGANKAYATPFDNNIFIGTSGGNIISTNVGTYEVAGSRCIELSNATTSIIANNYATVNVTADLASAAYGIGTGGGSNTSYSVYDNHVTVITSGNSANCWAFYINSGANGYDNTVNVYGNYVENSNLSGNTSGEFRAFYFSTAPKYLYIYNNHVTNNTIGSSSKTGRGPFTGFYINAYQNIVGSSYHFYNNTASGNSRIQSAPNTGVTHLLNCDFSAREFNIYNNVFENNSFPTSSSIVSGIYTTNTGDSKNIHHNVIRNLTTTNGILYGIYSQNGSTNNIYKNEIYNLQGTGSSAIVNGLYNYSGNSCTISNNYISDLKAPASTNTNAITGLYIAGGIGCYVYYNTVYLNASSNSVTTFGSSALYTTNTPTVLDLRNNIFVNTSTPVGTAYTVAHRRSTNYITNFSANTRRNCYYAGTPGPNRLIYYNGTDADQTILNYRVRVYPGELSSLSELPPFLNISTAPYDLHLTSGSSTGCESGGNLVSITDDFDDDPRYPNSGYPDDPSHPAVKPDMGADEFAGIHIDNIPPLFVLTPLANTTLLTGRTLTVTITDESNVPTSGDGLPVLYWKINNGAWISSTANWSGGSDYSFDLGTGVVPGDFVYYYLAAQDEANPINVGIYPGDGASSFTANPPACLIPSPSPLSYYILIELEGDFTVPGSYPTLTGNGGLFQTLNNNILIGDINVTITGDLTEPGTHALNQLLTSGGNWLLNISPDAPILRTISGDYAGGLIRMNGADNVTFDGRYNGNGNYFAFSNLSSVANTSVFQLTGIVAGQGSANVTIRNSNISAGSNTINSTFCIYAAGSSISSTGTGFDNDNLIIIENNLTKAWYGVYAVGESSGKFDGLQISGNIIGDEVPASYISGFGIYLKQSSGIIKSNTVKNIQNSTTTPPVGIYTGDGCSNFSISRNDIHSVKYTGTSNYGGHGLDLLGSNLTVDNNLIYDISGKGSSSMTTNAITGIRVLGGSYINLYYNSVHLYGSISRSTSTDKSAALYLANSSHLDIRNNAFINGIENTTGTSKSYAIYADVTSNEFLPSDYNDIFAYGPEAFLGYVNSANRLTLAEWQTTTLDDLHSISADPLFTTNQNLIPLTGSPLIGTAQPIPALINYDFTGMTRNLASTTIGAYEMIVSSEKTLNLTLFLEGLYAGTGAMNQASDEIGPHFGSGIADQVIVELHNETDYSVVEYSSGLLDLSTSGIIEIDDIPGTFSDSYYITVKHRNSIETTTSLPVSFSEAIINYAFDLPEKAFGNNLGLMIDGTSVIFTGDSNRDQIVDGGDLSDIANLADLAEIGYIPEDLNGDGLIDATDLSIAGNNSDIAVGAITP